MRKLIATAAIALMLSGACGKDNSKSAMDLSCDENAAPVDRDKRFRENIGLSTSDEAMEAARNSNSEAALRYAAPLTDAEVQRIDAFQAVRRLADPVVGYMHDHPAEYANFYTEWKDGGGNFVVQVAPNGSAEPLQAVMAQQGIAPSYVRFDQVDFSEAEIRAIQDNFTTIEAPKLRARGIDVGGVGQDGHSGVVRVRIRNLTEDLRSALAAEYPDLRFEIECFVNQLGA